MSQSNPESSTAASRPGLDPRDRLDAYLNGVESLPPTPSLMLKLLALFKQSDPDIDEVVKLTSRDPSLTSEILKRCNSARIRGEAIVSDMFEAVSRVGFYELYRIIMAVSAVRVISVDTLDSVIQVESLGRHSVATAVAAGVIAKSLDEPGDTAFLAGLLHDIGKIVLASAEGKRYRILVREHQLQNGAGDSLSELEKKTFGFHHSEVGAHLLDSWKLPPNVVTGVRHHHSVAAAPDAQRLAAIVSLADMFANGAEKKSATDAASLRDLETSVAILNFTPDSISEIMAQAHDEMKRDSALLSSSRKN